MADKPTRSRATEAPVGTGAHEQVDTAPADGVPDDPLAAAERAAATEAAALAATTDSQGERTSIRVPERVDLAQGGIDAVTADEVNVSQGGIGRLTATDVAVSRGAVGMARADRVSVELGALGGALGGEVRVTQALVGGLAAREARVGQSLVRGIVAGTVIVDRPSGVLFLVARRVEGNVRVAFDWRGGLAFGAAFGLVAALVRRLRD